MDIAVYRASRLLWNVLNGQETLNPKTGNGRIAVDHLGVPVGIASSIFY